MLSTLPDVSLLRHYAKFVVACSPSSSPFGEDVVFLLDAETIIGMLRSKQWVRALEPFAQRASPPLS
jgi:hypothetical protein